MEAIVITLSAAQMTAVRKISLSSDKSPEQVANELFHNYLKSRTQQIAKDAGAKAAKKYDGFAKDAGIDLPMTRAEFVKQTTDTYRELVTELNDYSQELATRKW